RVSDRAVPRVAGALERPLREPLRGDRRRAARTRGRKARNAAWADRSRRPPRSCPDGGSGDGGGRGSAAGRGARAGGGDGRERGGAAPARPLRRGCEAEIG